MSNFLLNHPISHTLVINVILLVAGLALLAAVSTATDIIKLPSAVWAARKQYRRLWIVVSIGAALLFPAALVVSLGWLGHDGMAITLPAFAVSGLWWWRTRKRLLARTYESGDFENSIGSPTYSRLFAAADTLGAKAVRCGFVVLAIIGFGMAMPDVIRWNDGDPATVYIESQGQPIAPRTYIDAKCGASVRRTLHLLSPDVELNGRHYQRWSVVPVPGHLDEVLLDTDSGSVICP